MAFIQITTPGDVLGTITAICNTITSLAMDQSPEGRAAAHLLMEMLAPLNWAVSELNKKLGWDPTKPKVTVQAAESIQLKS